MRFLSCVCLELAVCRAVRRMMGMTRTGWYLWGVWLVLYVVSACVPLPNMGVPATYAGLCWLFAMPCLLCWWAAVMQLRRDACHHRTGWLWVMFAGPSCLLAVALGFGLGLDRLWECVGFKPRMSDSQWDLGLVMAIASVAWSLVPYVLEAMILKFLLLPAPAPRVDEETPQV